MARFISYRSCLEILDGTKSEQELVALLHRIPVFILLRCNLEGDTSSSYAAYLEVCKKFPLFKDFALSRFISATRTNEMISYYIPKLDFDFWTERYIYYSEKFPYQKLHNILIQTEGLYEFYLTRNFHSDVYNLYFENITDLKLAILKFCPTDMLLGSFIEEHIYRHPKSGNFIVPIRKDMTKLEVNLKDFHRSCCEGNKSCLNCWFFIGGSVLIIDEALRYINRNLTWYFIYNGNKGYMLYLIGNHDICTQAMRRLVNRQYETDISRIHRELHLIMDFIPEFTNLDNAVMRLTPNFEELEYNTYSRLPFSINNFTGRICEVMDPRKCYKKTEPEYLTVHEVLRSS